LSFLCCCAVGICTILSMCRSIEQSRNCGPSKCSSHREFAENGSQSQTERTGCWCRFQWLATLTTPGVRSA
jgi:hypothetical protein